MDYFRVPPVKSLGKNNEVYEINDLIRRHMGRRRVRRVRNNVRRDIPRRGGGGGHKKPRADVACRPAPVRALR